MIIFNYFIASLIGVTFGYLITLVLTPVIKRTCDFFLKKKRSESNACCGSGGQLGYTPYNKLDTSNPPTGGSAISSAIGKHEVRHEPPCTFHHWVKLDPENPATFPEIGKQIITFYDAKDYFGFFGFYNGKSFRFNFINEIRTTLPLGWVYAPKWGEKN